MNKSEKFWNKIADKSSDDIGKTALKTLDLSKVFLTGEDFILDFGCGNGSITNQLADKVNHIDAIDTSPKMIEVAKEKAKKLSLKNINYQKSELNSIIENNEIYDVVVCFNVLHYIEDIESEINKISQLLKPNGLFISSTVCLKETLHPIRIFMSIFSKLGVLPATKFFTRSILEDSIEKGKFTVLKSDRVSGLGEYFIVAQKFSD